MKPNETKIEDDLKETSKAQPMEEESVKTDEQYDSIKSETFVGKIFKKFIPSVPHMVDLSKKLVEGEDVRDTARVRHYSEIQFVLGLLATILGFLLMFTRSGFFFILFFSGLYIILTAYEIEDIAITTQRLILRRIGIWERIIKIPTEEEHLLEHIVSFSIGRAPFNWVLVTFGLLGIIGAIALAGIPVLSLILTVVSAYILMRGMRLGNRTVTVHFAGGHHSILGLRKGVPEHAVASLKKAVFRIK